MSKVIKVGNALVCNPQVNTGTGVNLEDLCIYVDLEVEVRGRLFCMGTSIDGSKMRIAYDNSIENASFFTGQKDNVHPGSTMLSTFFVDNTYNDKEANTIEGLGIKSINIDYDSWYRPMVSIEFVDVRGASLFMQREKVDEGQTIAHKFFSAFFNFPYPTYTLTVKGFYGQPVRYKLYCTDVKAEFDAATGNYLLHTKFLGHFFAFVEDIEMAYLRCAPYCQYGNGLWKNNEFQGPITFKEGTKIMSLDALYPKLLNLENDVDKLMVNSEYMEGLHQHTEKIEAAQRLRNRLRSLGRTSERYGSTKIWQGKDEYGSERTIVFFDSSDADANKIVESEISRINELIKETLPDFYAGDVVYGGDTMPRHLHTFTKSSYDVNVREHFKGLNGIVKLDLGSDKYEIGYGKTTYNYLHVYEISIIEQYFEDYINREKQSCNEIERTIKDEGIKNVTAVLGFVPSIDNFIRLLCAHLWTFMHIFYTCIKNIGDNRKLSDIGLTVETSDNRKNDDTAYPFPAVYKLNKDNHSEESWLGAIRGGTHAEEVKLIAALDNALIESIQSQNNSDALAGIGDGISVSYIPMNPIDYIINGDTNPYNRLADGNIEDFLAALIQRLFLFGGGHGKVEMSDDALRDLARAEAVNIAKVLSSPDNEIVQALKNNYATCENAQKIKLPGMDPILRRVKQGSDTFVFGKVYPDSKGKVVISPIPLSVQKIDKWPVKADKYAYKSTTGDYYTPVDVKNAKADGLKNESVSYPTNMIIIDEDGFNERFISRVSQGFKQDGGLGDGEIKMLNDYSAFKPDYRPSAFDSSRATCNCEFYSRDNGYDNYETKKGIKLHSDSPTSSREKNYGVIDKTVGFEKVVSIDPNHPWEAFKKFQVKKLLLNNGKERISPFLLPYYYEPTTSKEEKCLIYLLSIIPYVKPEKDNVIVTTSGPQTGYGNTVDDSIYRRNYFGWHFTDTFMTDQSKKDIRRVGLCDILVHGGLLYLKSRGELDEFVMKVLGEKPGRFSMYDNINENYLYNQNENSFVGIFLEWVKNNYSTIQTFELRDCTERILEQLKKDCRDSNKSGYDIVNKYGIPSEHYAFVQCNESNYGVNYELEFVPQSMAAEFPCDILSRSMYIATLQTCPYNYKTVVDPKNAESNDELKGIWYTSMPQMNSTRINQYLKLFTEEFQKACDRFNADQEASSQALEDAVNSNLIKQSKYYYLKTLYDKWFAGIKLDSEEFKEEYQNYYQRFKIVDRAYDSYPADHCYVNLTKYVFMLFNNDYRNVSTTYRMGSLISKVLQDHNFMFMPLSNLKVFTEAKDIEEVFKPIPFAQINWNKLKKTPYYLCMYVGRPASNNGAGDDGYGNDTFDLVQKDGAGNYIGGNEVPADILANNAGEEELKKEYNGKENSGHFMAIPSFIVAANNPSESIFKRITVNMNEPVSTEQSIIATVGLTEKAPGQGYLASMDLYNIYSNRSYKCEIEMMGDAQIQPFMLFQLTNIPMWNGTYVIYKISHHITPGQFITKFTGMRIQKRYPYFNDEVIMSNLKLTRGTTT